MIDKVLGSLINQALFLWQQALTMLVILRTLIYYCLIPKQRLGCVYKRGHLANLGN
jgi:hypothetical protein